MWCCIQCSSDEEKMQWGRKEYWKSAFADAAFRMLKDPKTRCYNVLSGLLASVEKKESAFIACHFSKKQTESHSQECNPVQCQKNINRSVPRARFGNVVIAAEFTVIIHRTCDISILAYPLSSWKPAPDLDWVQECLNIRLILPSISHIPDCCLPDLAFVLPDFGNLPLPLLRLPVINNQTIDVEKRKWSFHAKISPSSSTRWWGDLFLNHALLFLENIFLLCFH